MMNRLSIEAGESKVERDKMLNGFDRDAHKEYFVAQRSFHIQFSLLAP